MSKANQIWLGKVAVFLLFVGAGGLALIGAYQLAIVALLMAIVIKLPGMDAQLAEKPEEQPAAHRAQMMSSKLGPK
jgi:hypothetical protein